MATPLSLKSTPLTKLGDFFGTLDDDYTYGTFETWKLKSTSTNGAVTKYKLAIKEDAGKFGPVKHEGSFQFPISNYFAWLGFRGNELKFHVDLGKQSILKLDWNFYANLKTTQDFSNKEFRFGVNQHNAKCETGLRFAFTNGKWTTTYKNLLRRNDLLFAFCLESQGCCNLSRYDAALQYSKNDSTLTLKHASNVRTPAQGCAISLGKVSVCAERAIDSKTKLALKSNDILSKDVAVGGSRVLNDKWTAKGKLDKEMNLSLSGKWKYSQTVTCTLASQIQLNKILALDKLPKFGFQVEMTI